MNEGREREGGSMKGRGRKVGGRGGGRRKGSGERRERERGIKVCELRNELKRQRVTVKE